MLRQHKDTLLSPSNLQQIQSWDPFRGDIEYLNGGESIRLSRSRLNENELIFQTGVVQAEFESESARLQFESLYGAKVIDETRIGDEVVYLMTLNLERAPLPQVFELLHAYNQGIPVDIESVNFSSVAAMQTFVIMLDAMTNHSNGLKGLSFNQMAEGQSELPVYAKDITFNPFFYGPIFPWENYQYPQDIVRYKNKFTTYLEYDIPRSLTPLISYLDPPAKHYNWALMETGVTNAWNYSLGTGVTVAWLDQNARLLHPELKRRFVSTAHNPTQESCVFCGTVRAIDLFFKGLAGGRSTPALNQAQIDGQAEHGHYAMMVGFAEKDNGIASAGVAPNARVMPFSVTLAWDATLALGSIRKYDLKVDIIGTSVGWKKWEYDTMFVLDKVIASFSGNLGLEKELEYLGSQNTIFVNHAGNENVANDSDLAARQYIPSLQMPHVLSVSNSRVFEQQSFTASPFLTGQLQRHLTDAETSNYYQNQDSFWAPGTDIPVAHHLFNSYPPQPPVIFGGTSAASPFMTGVIALMKSRNPDLTPAQIKTILRVTGRNLDSVFNKPGLNRNKTYFVNALEAVKMAIRMKDLDVESYQAKTYYGLVGSQPGSFFLYLNEQLNPGAQPHERKKRLIQSVSDIEWAKIRPGAFVKIQGWSGISTGTSVVPVDALEVLRIEPVEYTDLQRIQQECLRVDGSCLMYPNTTPFITNAQFDTTNPSFADGFNLTLSGENLFARLSATNAIAPFILELQKITPGIPPSPVLIAIPPENILSINNQGEKVKIKVPKQSIAKGNYQIRLNGQLIGLWYRGNTTGFFIEDSPQTQGFSIKANDPAPTELPTSHYIFDQIGNRWIRENGRVPVETNTFAGLYFTKPIRELTIKVGPVELPVVSVLRDLAVFGIPEDLPAGVHELTVEVDGQTLTLKDAIEKITPAVQPTPEPSPPPSASPERHEYLRAFNVEGNDEARIYVNGQLALTAHAGDDGLVSIGPDSSRPLYTDRPNEIIFEYENRGGGYTLGFKLESWRPRFYHEQGKPGVQNVLNPDGTEDQRQGVVFRERLLIHQTAHPIGSGKLWAKVFNMDDESLQLSTYNYTSDIQWNEDRIATPGKNGEWVKQLPWPASLYCDGYVSPGIFDECFSSYQLSISRLMNPSQTYSYGLEIYRGIHRIYHNVQGQPGGWGANDNDSTLGDIYLYENVEVPVYGHYPF